MSHTNRNFVIAYIFLVILPVIALAGILRVGRGVKSPVSVDGLWTVRMDSSQLDRLPCGKALAGAVQNSMQISQSGETFELAFLNSPKISATGVIDGATLRASLSSLGNWPGCGPTRKLSLVTTIDSSQPQKVLSGKLSADDCSSCTPVDFYALRQAAPASREGH